MKDLQREQILRLFPEINEIKEAGLREKVVDAWLIAVEEGGWKKIDNMPWIPGRAEFITNIQHCRGVARIGMAIVHALQDKADLAPGVIIDADTVIASCLLHDVGKVLEYSNDINTPGEKTPLGKYMMHHILGAYIAIKAGLPPEIVHCIESHREPESFKRSYEARILLYSDILHAEAMVKVHPDVSIL
jgi:putative nucleotidyltransferase with HDIG domain